MRKVQLLWIVIFVAIFSLYGCKKNTLNVSDDKAREEKSERTAVQVLLEEKEKKAQHSDWLIVPEKRVGAITPDSSYEQLAKAYGEDKIKDAEFYIAEGFCEAGSVLFPDEPDKTLEILWGDKENNAYPTTIQMFQETTQWHTEEGVKVGVTANKLLALNQSAFTFSGLGWDYGGYIDSWKNGELSRLNNISLRLSANGELTDPDINIFGEGIFHSDDLKPIAGQITVSKIVFNFAENSQRYPNDGSHQKECSGL